MAKSQENDTIILLGIKGYVLADHMANTGQYNLGSIPFRYAEGLALTSVYFVVGPLDCHQNPNCSETSSLISGRGYALWIGLWQALTISLRHSDALSHSQTSLK